MPIHEVSLIRPENLRTQDQLVVDGVDVSGHWSTFIQSRAVTDYNEAMQDEIAALPGGEHVHRCWQCGSCTNSCTVNAINPDFNPRYWIYLIRLGMESEILRDKDIIWQCVVVQQVHLRLPARRRARGRDEGAVALDGVEGARQEIAVDGVRRGVLRAGVRARQDRGRARHAALLQAHGPEPQPGVADRDGEADAAPPAGDDADQAWPRDAGRAEHQQLVRRPGGHRGIRPRAGAQAPARARARRTDRGGEAGRGARRRGPGARS